MRARRRKGLFLAVYLVLTLACSEAVRANSGGRIQPSAVTVSQDCVGRCAPHLVPLASGLVAAIWAADNGRTWVQLVDPSKSVLLGAPVDLGRLNAGRLPLPDQPLVVPAPDDDLILVGALADGRISFVRGSRSADRRVAPRIIVDAHETSLLGMAASADSDGLVLAVLRRQTGFDPDLRSPSAAMVVELHSLSSKGDTVRTPVRFTAPTGFMPSVKRFGSKTVVAWRVADRVVAQFVSADGAQVESTLRLPRGGSPVMGELVTLDGELGVLLGRRRVFDDTDLMPELLFAPLKAGARDVAWRTFKVPGRPVTQLFNEGRLAVVTEPQLNVLMQSGSAKQLASVNVQSGKAVNSLKAIAGVDTCVVTGEASALCATARRLRSGSDCPARPVAIELSSPTQVLQQEQGKDYWAKSDLADMDRWSPADRTQSKRLTCTEPAFAVLRAALEAWCKEQPKNGARRGAEFCSAEQPSSLLFQAVQCRDYPVNCPLAGRRVVPSVDRSAFDRGEQLELSYMGCSVAFERRAGSWAVARAECAGD